MCRRRTRCQRNQLWWRSIVQSSDIAPTWQIFWSYLLLSEQNAMVYVTGYEQESISGAWLWSCRSVLVESDAEMGASDESTVRPHSVRRWHRGTCVQMFPKCTNVEFLEQMWRCFHVLIHEYHTHGWSKSEIKSHDREQVWKCVEITREMPVSDQQSSEKLPLHVHTICCQI